MQVKVDSFGVYIASPKTNNVFVCVKDLAALEPTRDKMALFKARYDSMMHKLINSANEQEIFDYVTIEMNKLGFEFKERVQ